jgi:hypothetical protein
MAFGVIKVHALLALHKYHHNHNKAKAAAELHKTSMEKEYMGRRRNIHYRKPRCGPSAYGLKQSVNKIQLPRKRKRQSAKRKTKV